jgi:N-acetyl sugar amidotransferase
MEYCSRCVYPKNAQPYIIFDEKNVCSGCRSAEKNNDVDWNERENKLQELFDKHKSIAHNNKNMYDCIIPVSGGKDSHYQVYIVKEIYGLNPLLVTYNHLFNTPLGNRNLKNLLEKFSCDHIRFSSSTNSIKKLSKYMLKKCGDVTWHYHAGITTFPIQMAIKFNIPLIVWAENNFSNLTGIFNPDDMVEFSRKARKDLALRGIEAVDAIGHDKIDERDIYPFQYPSDEEIERVGVRGIYLSNYLKWDEKFQAEKMIELYDFGVAKYPREKSFNLYSKLEDFHSNGLHDYLKFLKYGYGRGTDDASTAIRTGRITREEGINLVERYDSVKPKDLYTWLEFVDMSENEFYEIVNSMRDSSVWKKNNSGEWILKDTVINHMNDQFVEEVKLPLINENNKEFIDGRYDVYDPRWILEYNGYLLI